MKPIKFLIILFILGQNQTVLAQEGFGTSSEYQFSGTVNVTNNGISLVPNFSLGKPAVIFNLSTGKNRFSLDQDIRFSLSAKPWTMLFWGRYKLVPEGKFKLTTGAHLGLNYKTTDLAISGVMAERNIVRRYLAAEMAPNYSITKNIGVGMYYLYSRGLDEGTIKNSNFVVFNTNFSNIKLGNQFYAKLTPQAYFLQQDDRQGTYFTANLALAKKDFPISIYGMINQRLSGDIAGSDDFIWSAGLIYSFNQKFILK